MAAGSASLQVLFKSGWFHTKKLGCFTSMKACVAVGE